MAQSFYGFFKTGWRHNPFTYSIVKGKSLRNTGQDDLPKISRGVYLCQLQVCLRLSEFTQNKYINYHIKLGEKIQVHVGKY